MKKPEEIKIMLNVERKKSEFVRWDGKPLYDYFINIPTWLSQSYLEHGSNFVILKVSNKKSMHQKMQEQNESEWRPWIKERWIKKLQMNISDRGLRELKDLQDDMEASSMAEVIRSSLKVFRYLEEQKKRGNKIVVKNPKDNTETEILL